MEKKLFTVIPIFFLMLFAGCKQRESHNNGQNSDNNCTITISQFFLLAGAEDTVVTKILPHCFKIDRRGEFREFTAHIAIYDSSNTEYYDQFKITTDYNNRSLYYTTSNQKNYVSYKDALMNSFVLSDTSEYGEQVFVKDGFRLLLRETEPNGQKRYTIYLRKVNK